MKPLITTMHYQEDPNTGEYGLSFGLELDYPTVASEGLLVAHDIIEHVNGLDGIGTIADELQAISGIWLTRGSTGELRRDRVGSAVPIDENVWSDVQNMATMVATGQSSLIFRSKPTEDDYDSLGWCEHLLDDVEGLQEYIEAETDETMSIEWCQQYLDTVAYHLIKGEVQYHRNYADMASRFGEYAPNTLFWDIAERMDAVLQDEPWNGVSINIDFDRMNVDINIIEGEY